MTGATDRIVGPLPPGSLPPTRLYVGTPCFGGSVSHNYLISLMRLHRRCLEAGLPFSLCSVGGDALITRARNTIVEEFLADPDATHLMFIDADIGFDPQSVFDYLGFGAPIVAGIYPTKSVNWANVAHYAGHVATEALPAHGLDYVVEFETPSRLRHQGRFARARRAGTGFMLIQRHVFDALRPRLGHLAYRSADVMVDRAGVNRPGWDRNAPPKVAYFDTAIDPETGVYLSEDYAFCRHWVEAGGTIWVDLESRLDHVGCHVFRGDFTSQLVRAPFLEEVLPRAVGM